MKFGPSELDRPQKTARYSKSASKNYNQSQFQPYRVYHVRKKKKEKENKLP
jgi:hypothetical protein